MSIARAVACARQTSVVALPRARGAGRNVQALNERPRMNDRLFSLVRRPVMKLHCLAVVAAVGLFVGVAFSHEPKRTYRAYCSHASHGGTVRLTGGYLSIGPAWMMARKHNEANPGHDAAVAILLDAPR